MKIKKTFLFILSLMIFLGGVVLLRPVIVRANYAASVAYSCPSGGSLVGSNCFVGAICKGGSERRGVFIPSYACTTTPNNSCSDSFNNTRWNFDSSCNSIANGSTVPNISIALGACWMNSSGIRFCNQSIASYTYAATMVSYSCPSGGILSGTTCLTDNGCAANTCTTATCNNGTATVPGTKTDGACCVDNTWTPSAASVCPSQTVTQLSNCGRTRVVPGTSSPAFSPDPSKCYNVSYPQTNGCSWQLAVGTSKAETCCGSGADQTPGSFWNQWSPSSNMACSSATVAQTATCNNIPGLTKSQTVSGGTFPTPGACGSANNQATNTLPNPSALCDLGSATPSPLTGLGPWSWSCNGLCGGASTSCQTLSPMTISGWKEVAP